MERHMNNKISCTYIGQSTTLISIGDTSVLTDPHFGRRALFFKRHTPLTYDASKLPPLSCVLLSHAHFDHLDVGSFKYISQKTPVFVPEGLDGVVSKFIVNPVIELSLYASHTLPDGTKITAVPARHRGGRYSHVRYTGACGYLIEKEGRVVLFSCDSAYGPHFEEIGNLAAIDVALIPIGGYMPRWFMSSLHMTPSQTVQAFEDVKARHMIAIHWGSFLLSLEPIDQPVERLNKVLEERPDLKDRIHVVPHGEQITIE